MTNLITLPALSSKDLMVTVDVHGKLQGFYWNEESHGCSSDAKAETIAKENAVLFSGGFLILSKVTSALDMLDANRWRHIQTHRPSFEG